MSRHFCKVNFPSRESLSSLDNVGNCIFETKLSNVSFDTLPAEE